VALRDRRLAQLILFAAFAVLHTWPLMSAPGTWSRMDNADTALNAWIVAWVAHQLPLDPLRLFDANIFYPEPRALAFSEHMVVQGVMGLPLFAAGLDAVVVYNVLVVLGFALSGFAMCRVVTRWSGDGGAGLVAGLAYAFNAHTLVRFGHLQALHVQFLPLALAAFHDLRERPRWQAALGLAGWVVLQSLTSNYLLVMTAVALVAAAAAVPRDWFGPGASARLGFAVLAALLASAVLVPFLLPYYYAKVQQGLVRPVDEVAYYSAQWRDYLATGGRLHYAWWSHRVFAGATPNFPGLTVLALAGVAVGTGRAWRDARLRTALVIVIVGVLLSFGMHLPGYRWLYDHVVLLQGVRAVARFGWLALFGLAFLAGEGLAALRHGRPPATARALVVVAAVAVTVEAARFPMAFTRYGGMPPIYAHVSALPPDAVLVELPFPDPAVVQLNGPYVLASTAHFRPLLNGYSGFTPRSYHQAAGLVRMLPSSDAFDGLAAMGVTHAVLHGAAVAPEFVRGLEAGGRAARVASEGDDRLYALR
jgi:hypothetical protein